MLRSALLGMAALFLFVAFLAGCGGGSSNNPPAAPVTQNSITETIAAPGTPNAIPAVGGFSGSFIVAKNDAGAGTTIMLTSYSTVPGAAPAPQSIARHVAAGVRQGQPLVSPTVLFWVSHVYSQTVTFDAFPITSWQLPSTPPAGTNFFLETFEGTTLLATEQATSVNGMTVNFPGVAKTFQALQGQTYWWELITSSGFAPVTPPPSTPTPAPTATPTSAACVGSQSVSQSISEGGATVSLPTVCGFIGFITLPANDAASGTTIKVSSNVPSPGTGIPAIPSGSRAVYAIESSLSANVDFGAGFLQFTLTLPASVPATGETFQMIACDVANCQPFNSGPLPITGQTISFGGIPLPFSITANHTYIGQIYETP